MEEKKIQFVGRAQGALEPEELAKVLGGSRPDPADVIIGTPGCVCCICAVAAGGAGSYTSNSTGNI